MKTLNHTDFQSDGEIKARQTALFKRLHDEIYMPHYVFTADQNGWPGDWEGRTILALVSLAKVLKEEPKYLDGIIEKLNDHLNENGYLGHILPKGIADEQQLSGHSWLLRGLCEYYRYRKNERVLEIIKGIVRNLFLPIRKNYESYPILPEQRVYEGYESGNVAGMVNNWHISTDTGCAFIPLDGLSDALELLLEEDTDLAKGLNYMLGYMIDVFASIPFTKICVQTHATLTGLRGIMRMYKLTKNHAYLSIVKSIFDLYINEGMTANFANYNWFGRPEWTEPCAIIDSFMLACQLFRETEEQRYVDYANYILYNGIYRSQRNNGGFGTDNCAGPFADYVVASTYEAYWCCTMRGGEGLFAVSQYSLLERDKDIVILYPVSGIYKIHNMTLKISTDYPKTGNITIKVLENNNDKNVILDMLMLRTLIDAKFLHNEKLRKVVITKDRNEYVIDFKIPLYYKLAEGKHNKKDRKLLMYGSVILGSLDPDTVVGDINDMEKEGFIPLYDTSFTKPRNRVEKDKIYILFESQS